MSVKFICLDPRKLKKRWMQTMLAATGEVRFIRFAPVGLAAYPEAYARATKALATATKQPRSKIMRRAKLWLLKWQYAGSRAYFSRNPDAVAVAWNGLNGTRNVFMEAAKDAGNKTLFFELAPFVDRITIDPQGVNFSNSLPRKKDPYLAWAAINATDPKGWHKLRDTITQRKPLSTVFEVNGSYPITQPFIFVPLQVPGDSQLRIYGGAFNTVERFVATILEAAEHCPKGWHIRIKEHPSAKPFVWEAIEKAGCVNVVLDNATDTFEQVRQANLIVTVNSSVGLEAMFFEKPVVACGDCFWAFEGIAVSAKTTKEIANVLLQPDAVTFDPHARGAFLNFIEQSYYPKLSKPKDAAILTRIAGRDENGFWDADTSLKAQRLS